MEDYLMKVLFWDLETSPIVVNAWGLWKPYLTHENIVKESNLICAAWKWLGGKRVSAASVVNTAPDDDRALVETLHAVLSTADVLVGHNGDKFDLRKFNTRVIAHKLPPLPPIPTIDTLKVARKHFAFTSNRLDYLGEFLGMGRKVETAFKLWLKVMAGDKRALTEMVAYNKQDVLLLERVYLALRPFMRNHPNVGLHNEADCCPNCGSKEFIKQGFKHSRVATRQQYQCTQCRAWFCGGTVKTVKTR
jgi:hypothetical protein